MCSLKPLRTHKDLSSKCYSCVKSQNNSFLKMYYYFLKLDILLNFH